MVRKPVDRRVARTRAALHQALLSLVAEKGYEAISVEDICERANVGRSTFYAHHASKDDLMRSGLKGLRDELVNGRNAAAVPKDRRGRGLAFSLPMFEHARAHAHFHHALLGHHGSAIALETIRGVLSDLVRSELAGIAGKGSNDAMPRELVVQYLVGAYMAVVAWWLDRGAKLGPDRVDAMFQRLVADGLTNALR